MNPGGWATFRAFRAGYWALNVTRYICERENDLDVVDCLFAQLFWITSLMVEMLRDARKWPNNWHGANCVAQQLGGQTGLSWFRFTIIDQHTPYQAAESLKKIKGSANMMFSHIQDGALMKRFAHDEALVSCLRKLRRLVTNVAPEFPTQPWARTPQAIAAIMNSAQKGMMQLYNTRTSQSDQPEAAPETLKPGHALALWTQRDQLSQRTSAMTTDTGGQAYQGQVPTCSVTNVASSSAAGPEPLQCQRIFHCPNCKSQFERLTEWKRLKRKTHIQCHHPCCPVIYNLVNDDNLPEHNWTVSQTVITAAGQHAEIKSNTISQFQPTVTGCRHVLGALVRCCLMNDMLLSNFRIMTCQE